MITTIGANLLRFLVLVLLQVLVLDLVCGEAIVMAIPSLGIYV